MRSSSRPTSRAESVEDTLASDLSANACEPTAASSRPAGAAPVSLADVLRRVGAANLLDDDQEKEAENVDSASPPVQAAVENQPVEAASEPGPLPIITSHHDGEEESIDDYMTRLMERVRSGSSGPPSSTRQPATWSQSPVAVPDSEPVVLAQVVEPPQPATVVKQQSQPTAMAPARWRRNASRPVGDAGPGQSLGQERHWSTRPAAIDPCHTGQIADCPDGGGCLRSAVLVVENAGANPITLHAGVASLIVAIYWGTQYAISTGHLIVGRFGRVEWKWDSSQSERQ